MPKEHKLHSHTLFLSAGGASAISRRWQQRGTRKESRTTGKGGTQSQYRSQDAIPSHEYLEELAGSVNAHAGLPVFPTVVEFFSGGV